MISAAGQSFGSATAFLQIQHVTRRLKFQGIWNIIQASFFNFEYFKKYAYEWTYTLMMEIDFPYCVIL